MFQIFYIALDQWFSTAVILLPPLPRGHLAMSGDISGCPNCVCVAGGRGGGGE